MTDKPQVTKEQDHWQVTSTITSRDRNLTLKLGAHTWEEALRIANGLS